MEKQTLGLSKAAIILGVSLLIAAWLVYDGLHSVAREIHDKTERSFPDTITLKGGNWPIAVKLTGPEASRGEEALSVKVMPSAIGRGEAFNVKVLPAPPATK